MPLATTGFYGAIDGDAIGQVFLEKNRLATFVEVFCQNGRDQHFLEVLMTARKHSDTLVAAI
jgi:hypothetical protein